VRDGEIQDLPAADLAELVGRDGSRPTPDRKKKMTHAADSLLRTWVARALEALWLTAAVAVPLALNPWGANAFELPKAVLLRALVLRNA